MDERCSGTRIINIQAATAGRQKTEEDREEAFHGNPWAAEWKSGRDSIFIPPSLVAAGQNYDPAPEAGERWRQDRATDLRRPLAARFVAFNVQR